MLAMLHLHSVASPPPPPQPVLCPSKGGTISGLGSDEKHIVRLPADAPTNQEKWMLTNDSKIKGSFTGEYLQVLPDDRDEYNDIYGQGSFTMTGLDFAFTVEKTGMHTLFLRWAGGDMGGGSDSLYAVVRRDDTDAIVPGPDMFKPKRIGIADNPGQYLGCCYHHATHECPCYTPDMRPESCEEEGGYWAEAAGAKRWGATCIAPKGEMEAVRKPLWYLFAGQDPDHESGAGAQSTLMDFDSPPWDSTCEAASTATKDSGMDFAQWQLKAGDIYHLVLYPREDGTAVDAFQLVPPGGTPPARDTRLKPGDTTLDCPGGPRFTSPVDSPGADVKHHEHDKAGWGHRGDGDANLKCGACLEPLTDLSKCPTPEQLFAMPTCDNVTEGEMCEADGECGTDSGGGVNVAALVVSLLLVAALLAGYVHLSRKTHGGAVVLPWNWHKVTRTGAAHSADPIVRSCVSTVYAAPYAAPSCPLSTAAVPSAASATALPAAGAGGATTYGLARDVRVAPA
ncbi:hypothetical protein EMIHUDRAFT_449550 [Emiliania huxleyi CCMP1516]|uniref:Uncharacterized protein n=2 Tax=Emiliania huxleyi TaxID=2903 RepID=A0A0D3K8T9_EMIH1|nr:hypothetical protein EMIHUDRAFT_449550 [Emiliania huxleyi CCMP1516]EOD32174.1 hypothetical protein EMIHUDRAFT_449550 [Emiliania huxleyi CCMP1516]|eukprot:XP_005784603.1 hypothetical protein EMIHUDRAFT_449550 [Emiliania huxleyi CCMP1516]